MCRYGHCHTMLCTMLCILLHTLAKKACAIFAVRVCETEGTPRPWNVKIFNQFLFSTLSTCSCFWHKETNEELQKER